MTNFDADTLRALRDVREAAICTEKHPKSAVVIWVFVAVARHQGALVQRPRGGRTRNAGVCRPPAGGAGDPGERPRFDCPRQPRIPAEISAELPCAGDGALRSPADHAAARAALTDRAMRREAAVDRKRHT